MEKRKVVVVTGGMGGLGEAICRGFDEEHYCVIATHSPGNQHVADWLKTQREDGHEFGTCSIDVADFQSCEQGARQILAEHGRIDILVNNAGITRDTTLRRMDLDAWQQVMHTNLDSIFNMSRQVIDGMLECGWGRIINISSVNGQKGAFGQTNYAAAKAGVHGFTKALALEVARKGVTVNTVSPGYLRTKMVMQVPADVMEKKILPDIPLGRLGEPTEVAALVAFLATDAAGFITGANLAINGGQHMC